MFLFFLLFYVSNVFAHGGMVHEFMLHETFHELINLLNYYGYQMNDFKSIIFHLNVNEQRNCWSIINHSFTIDYHSINF